MSNRFEDNDFLTKEVMPQSFGSREQARGRVLFQMNAVDTDSIEIDRFFISAHVKSQRSRSIYYVELALPSAGKRYFESDCSCPVGSDCKHGAALALHYIEYIAGESTKKPPTHVSDAEINQWLSELEQKPVKLKTLLYVLNESQSQAGFRIDIREGRQLKNGDWSKNSSKAYLSGLNYRHIADEDLQIVSKLQKDCDYQQVVRNGDVIKQMIDSGRCYLDTIDQPLIWGDPQSLDWSWQTIDEQSQVLQSKLNTEQSGISIWPSVPLTYYDAQQNTVGFITQAYPDYIASQLIRLPTVSNQQAAWIEKRVNKQLKGDKRLVKPILQGDEILSEGVPCLDITMSNDWSGKSEVQALLHFDYQGQKVYLDSYKPTYELADKTGYRDRDDETEKLSRLTELGLYTPSHYDQVGQETPRIMIQKKETQWYRFVHEHCHQLRQSGWRIELDPDLPFSIVEQDQPLKAELESIDNDYFSVAMKVNLSGQQFDAFPIIKSALEQLPNKILNDLDNAEEGVVYVEVEQEDNAHQGKNKAQVPVWPLAIKDISQIIKQFIELLTPKGLDSNGTLKLPKIQSHDTLAMLDHAHIQFSGAEPLQAFAKKLQSFEGIQKVDLPQDLQATLRDYQHHGVSWLQFLREYQLAGILADDMGLGKTLQTLCHLLIEKQQGRLNQPCLIVAPTSVVFNWGKEIEKFTPTLRTLTIQGDQKKRKLQWEDLTEFDVIVTSYPLLAKDLKLMQKHAFYYLVLDEAQTIKNAKTKLYTSVSQISAANKLCLTGTPIENHLGELWAQFNLLLPGFLGGQSQFNQLFRKPIEKEANIERNQMLQSRIQPFILRRTKQNIAKELPPKTEVIQTITMEGKQAELYETMRLTVNDKLRKIIDAKGLDRSKIEVLDAMLKLRQVCCHPQLLPDEKSAGVTESVKLDHLMDMLSELIEEDRKVLVFSQFTSMLDLIKSELEKQNIDYVELTGKTKNRQQVVERFENTTIPVFLISLKAGGVGLNLTAADTVIHFDPWWNPAAENQATDRAYRIGQDKPVFVYKLIINHSIEQKIQQLQQHKKALVENLLSEQTQQGQLQLTQDQISDLFMPLNQV
jgi:SNF2 family DNA or RNA helicase